ncbi:hypothetical protein A9L43_26320 [Pseudomonas mosselii]|uniref:HNH endonuclease n=1 Tax=Pseudomonas mosselii TaxID=78327 RepID=UPI00083E15AD|nr:HNH endonuclease [Pseudomonas mosselii]ODB34396.1 hypothetical protein A9L43_26320 [Pseudomonas mosselii]
MSITKSRLDELLSYDPESGDFTWKVNRGTAKAGSVIRRKNRHGYLVTAIDGKNFMLHRLAFICMGHPEPPDCVDHINGERSDNRWSNLRLATYTQNNRNQRLHSTNTSGIPGVMWDQRKRWRAFAYLDGRYLALGRYHTLLDAAAARKSFESRHDYHANHGK